MSAADKPAIEGGAPVRAERLPFFRPAVGEEEFAAVMETLRSGWLTVGPRTAEFRQAFLDYLGLPYGVPLNSCSSGLLLALRLLGIGEGDEVITTPNTFTSSVNGIHHVGATPVLADIEDLTFGLDPESVAAAITPKTRAILAVHYGGQPCQIEALRTLADERGLLLIEDAAHGFGARAGNIPVGGFGDLAAFSFYATKNLCTGEGGFLTCRTGEMEDEARMMGFHGMDHDAWKRYSDRGAWYYEVGRIGYKFNLTDPQAAMGLVQLRRADELMAARTRIAARYSDALASESALALPAVRADAVHSWHLYVPRILPGSLAIDRDRFLAALAAEGISPSLHFIPIHHHRAHRDFFGDLSANLPRSEAFYESCFSLPLYPDMTDGEVDQVCEAVSKLLRYYGSRA